MTRRPGPADVLYLLLIAIFWGSAFLFIEIALKSFPPFTIAASRILLGAVLLQLLVRARGKRVPRDWAAWHNWSWVAAIGTVLPFVLIPWAQERIDSSLVAIVMGTVPLTTMIFAHYLTPDEKLSVRKLLGLLLGFVGVVTLFGDVDPTRLTDDVVGLVAAFVAALGYASSAVIIRRGPNVGADVGAAGILTAAAVMSVPIALIVDQPWTITPTWDALAAIVVLGVFPSALAAILLVRLLFRVGATFTALNNYLVPLVGVACGAIWLDEPVAAASLVALVLILAGIGLTRSRGRSAGQQVAEDG